MNIVVTGSSGFIGNNLVAFLNLNHDVIGLDRLEGNNTKIQIDCKSKNLMPLVDKIGTKLSSTVLL